MISPNCLDGISGHSRTFCSRAREFINGDFEHLWAEAMELKAEQLLPRDQQQPREAAAAAGDERVNKKVTKKLLTKMGEVGYAFKCLEESGQLEVTRERVENVQNRLPKEDAFHDMVINIDTLPPGVTITDDIVARVMKSMAKGRAADELGQRAEQLLDMFHHGGESLLGLIANQAASGTLPEVVLPFYKGGRFFLREKSDKKERMVTIGASSAHAWSTPARVT
jgi:hypothetical protein